MESLIINGVVVLVQLGIKMAQKAGEDVDLTKVMATAAARAGATMADYEAQLEEQKALFPEG